VRVYVNRLDAFPIYRNRKTLAGSLLSVSGAEQLATTEGYSGCTGGEFQQMPPCRHLPPLLLVSRSMACCETTPQPGFLRPWCLKISTKKSRLRHLAIAIPLAG